MVNAVIKKNVIQYQCHLCFQFATMLGYQGNTHHLFIYLNRCYFQIDQKRLLGFVSDF